MKTEIKKMFRFLILFVLFSSTLYAQDTTQDPITGNRKKTSTERADAFIRQYQARLKLTTEQSTKMRELLIKMEDGRNLEMNQRKEERRKTEGEFSQLLTSDQMNEFRKIREERRAKMEERRKQMHQE